MKCITSTFFFLINNISGEPFKPERGIREDDPISPNINIIYAVFLGRYINFMINTQTSETVTIDDPVIPYLMFADDCTIFYR